MSEEVEKAIQAGIRQALVDDRIIRMEAELNELRHEVHTIRGLINRGKGMGALILVLGGVLTWFVSQWGNIVSIFHR